MGAIYDALLAAFTASGLAVDEHPDEGWMVTDGFGSHGSWFLVGQAYERLELAVVHAVYPAKVPDDQRAGVAMLLTHVNDGLVLGNLQIDLSTGDVRVKSSARVGRDPDPELIDSLVLTAHSLADRYLPAVSAVALGGDVATAVAGLNGG
jgi:hypothetical protein